MEEPRLKEVYFDQYCSTCKYKNLDISGNPEIVRDDNWKGHPGFFHDPDKAAKCHDCLNEGSNWDSHKPVNYEKEEPHTGSLNKDRKKRSGKV